MTFRTARTYRQMTPAQEKAFERSYKAYERYYNSQPQMFEDKMTKSEYFENYKLKYNELKSEGKTTAAIPRQLAAEQKYERSYAQDKAQFRAIKETENFKKLHGDMLFKEFRRLTTDDIKDFLWDEIERDKAELRKTGMLEQDINLFISQYYFGSV